MNAFLTSGYASHTKQSLRGPYMASADSMSITFLGPAIIDEPAGAEGSDATEDEEELDPPPKILVTAWGKLSILFAQVLMRNGFDLMIFFFFWLISA
jgi:hypothetical protein